MPKKKKKKKKKKRKRKKKRKEKKRERERERGKTLILWLQVFFFFIPTRIVEIWRPLLNACLKSMRVWNSDTIGNQDKMVIGMKTISPIM